MGEVADKEVVAELFDELHNLIWAMVWDICNPARWQLEAQEVFAELSKELVEVCVVYNDRPYDELKKLAITSMRNRVKDLAVMTYKTHRSAEANIADIDDVSVPIEIEYFDIEYVCTKLSPDACRLVQEVLWPSDRVVFFMELSRVKKEAISDKNLWSMKITPLFMERALGWSRDRLENAWDEVALVLADADVL